MKHVIYGDGVTRRTALAMSRGIALDIDCALVPTELAPVSSFRCSPAGTESLG